MKGESYLDTSNGLLDLIGEQSRLLLTYNECSSTFIRSSDVETMICV